MKKSLSLSIALFLFMLLPVAAPAFQWPDTGQTESYTDTFGEDSDYTINPPSYTKLDSQGNELSDLATSWDMVQDNVTGLIWEVKTDDGSIHDKDDSYTWQDAQDVFIAALNNQNFGGYSGWRMPTIQELSTIVNAGTYSPTINTDYFPNTVSSCYWSSTTDAYYTDNAWIVCGYVSSSSKSYTYYVRAVRGDGSFDNFVINGNGTVTDINTGLMWQQETAGSMDWEAAISYCENLSLAGYNDWRMPNRNELQTLVDYTTYEPAIDTTAFPDTLSSDFYWSSTTYARYTDYAWLVSFYYGHVSYYFHKSYTCYVRAVRGGQSGSFEPLVITGSASSVTSDSATLNGTVNPNGASATYYFEYGTTTTYGSATTNTSAGSGTDDVSVNAAITGLNSNTTYHYRLVATNSAGTSYGDDQTFATSALENGYLVTSDLWIRAVINTEEKGPIEAVWKKGGEDTTAAGDRVIWGHFYANPNDVTWGSENNPDLFVKIWFDHYGRVDVNFFHVSVPEIVVYSDYPYDGTVNEQGTTTMSRRYIRQYYENGQSFSDEQTEDGNPPSGYSQTGNPSGYSTINDLRIGSIINTVEKGPIDAIWQLGGQDTTSRGDQVVWGHFYASPTDVTWGSENNPDLFVKIWFDVSGRVDVNFFHVSVPDIEVYSDLPDDGAYDQKGTTIMDNRYIRHEYWR